MGPHGAPWGPHEDPWDPMGPHGFPWVPMGKSKSKSNRNLTAQIGAHQFGSEPALKCYQQCHEKKTFWGILGALAKLWEPTSTMKTPLQTQSEKGEEQNAKIHYENNPPKKQGSHFGKQRRFEEVVQVPGNYF